jgi:hypothetical protein
MDLTNSILAHPRVVATDMEINNRAELASGFIKAFDDNGNDFPIDFDDAWHFLGYSTKANGLRKFKGGGFKEGFDYRCMKGIVITANANPSEPDENVDLGGRPADKYYMTTNAFELFAMIAMTETGDKVRRFFRAMRDAYVKLTQMLQSGTDKEQAYILTYDKKNCIYIGTIQQQPRLCKFGFTANIKERYSSHKRTFASPYFFELRHVVEADDPKKAEEIFKNYSDIKDNVQQLKIGGSVQRETFLMPDTLTEERLYYLMRKACRQSASPDIVMSDTHDSVEIEREKTQQLQLQLQLQLQRDVELEKYRMDHEYRMEILKRKGCDGMTQERGQKSQRGAAPSAREEEDHSGEPDEEEVLEANSQEVEDDEQEDSQRNREYETRGEEEGNHEEEAAEDNVSEAAQFERNVHDIVHSLCEFGNDSLTMRTVDRFRADRVPLWKAFVTKYGKTPSGKFYEAVLNMEGVTPTVYSSDDRQGIDGFAGIRMKDRLASDTGEHVILKFLEEACEFGEDDFMINKSELLKALQDFAAARGRCKIHRGHGTRMANMLTQKGVKIADVRWRGSNSRVFSGIRPKSGYPSPKEVLRRFLEAKTQKNEEGLVKRAVLLRAFANYAKEHCKGLATSLTCAKMTQEMDVLGFELVTVNRDACFKGLCLS